MAPKPPKSSKGLGARLKRKVGPLPVWAWAAVILGAYLAYTRLAPSSMHASTSGSGDTPATSGSDTTTGSDSGAQAPSSGMGNPADQLAPVLPDFGSQFDSLAGQLQQLPTYADLGQLYDAINAQGTPTGAVSQAGAASAPAAQPSVAASAATRSTHLTQTPDAGVLKWGGKTFTTQAGFDAWARARGMSTAQALNAHPQARAIYSTLKQPTHKAAPKHAAAPHKAAAPVHKPAPKPKPKAKAKPAPKAKPKPPPRRPAPKAKAKPKAKR